jgi:hypothetical protein
METVDVLAVIDVVPPLQSAERLGAGRARQPLSPETELADIARTAIWTRNKK